MHTRGRVIGGRGELTIPRGLLSLWMDEWMVDQDDGLQYRVHGSRSNRRATSVAGKGQKEADPPAADRSESPSGESYDYALLTVRYVGGAQVSSLQV